MFHWGAIIAAPGYTSDAVYEAGGNPYGTSVTANGKGLNENTHKAVIHQVERTLQIARLIKSGQERDL